MTWLDNYNSFMAEQRKNKNINWQMDAIKWLENYCIKQEELINEYKIIQDAREFAQKAEKDYIKAQNIIK